MCGYEDYDSHDDDDDCRDKKTYCGKRGFTLQWYFINWPLIHLPKCSVELFVILYEPGFLKGYSKK